MTSLKTSIKTITYLSDTGCLEIQGASLLTEFCGLLAQTINGIRSYAGPFGKSDRALIFGLWGLAVAIYPQWMQWNNLLWGIASILLIWTAINRCRSVLLMSAER